VLTRKTCSIFKDQPHFVDRPYFDLYCTCPLLLLQFARSNKAQALLVRRGHVLQAATLSKKLSARFPAPLNHFSLSRKQSGCPKMRPCDSLPVTAFVLGIDI
jgi:hypothetical protein